MIIYKEYPQTTLTIFLFNTLSAFIVIVSKETFYDPTECALGSILLTL